MNWTGGRLQRHSGKSSRGGGALTSRQKEHFAKVKANLRSGGQKNSPAKWSIFDKIPVYQSEKQSSERHSIPVKHHEHSSRRKRERSGIVREGWDGRDEYDDEPPRSTLLHREHLTRHTNARSPSVEILRRSSLSDDDLYNATPPPLKIKRERVASPGVRDTPKDSKSQESREESMEEKRRKLLNKGDWVGLSIRRLPKLKFNPPKHDEEIGRRRKVKDGHRARYSKHQTRISSPFAARIYQMGERDESRIGERASKNDVRISIGGRVVPPGISSSSRPRKIARQSTPRTKDLMSSSDDMLLDDEYIIEDRDDMNSDRFLSVFEARMHGSGGNQDSAASIASSKDRSVHGTHRHRQNPERLELAPLSNSVCDARMKQPMPTRPAKHPVLHLSSPKCNSSVLAQVGKSDRVVPEDQSMDNEIWKTWTQDTGYDSFDFQREANTEDRRVSISPGVSAIPTFCDDAFSGSGSGNSGGQYENAESWRGCESSIMHETMAPDYGDISRSENTSGNSQTEVSQSLELYDHPLSVDSRELVSDTGVQLPSDQYTNEDDITIEPQYTRSSESQRTSSSIPWDPPQNSSPALATPYENKFINSFRPKASPLEQRPIVTRQIVEPEETTLQHGQIILPDQNPNTMKDDPERNAQKKTDQNELWMKFVFDEASEDDSVLSQKTISTRIVSKGCRSKSSEGANTRTAASWLPVVHEMREPSPTFSTLVHNSVDSESPLRPRYGAPVNDRSTRENSQLESNEASDYATNLSINFSTLAHQSNDYCSPKPPTRPRGTPHPSKDGRQIAYSTNSKTANPSNSSSSEPESVSMIAVPGSQVDVSESTQSRSSLGTRRKVVFTKPQPFVGLKASMEFSSPDRTMHIGGRGNKKEISGDYGVIVAEDIEDD